MKWYENDPLAIMGGIEMKIDNMPIFVKFLMLSLVYHTLPTRHTTVRKWTSDEVVT